MNAWPFLVSRNQYIDYRTVVAPDFICKAGISNILARTADGDLTAPGNAFIRKIECSNVGSFTIVFQVVEATERDINYPGGNAVLKDSFGREVFLIKGFVLKGKQNARETEVYQNDIDKSYEYSVEGYREFWKTTDYNPKITSSEAFFLEGEENSQPLRLTELPSFEVEPQLVPINLNLIVVIFVGLLAILGIIFASLSPKIFSHQKTKDDIVAVYNQNVKTRHIYVEITGNRASDGSDASGSYWIIGKEGENFIVTNDGKSIYKTGQQIIASKLILKVDHKVSVSFKEENITLNNQNVSEILKKNKMNTRMQQYILAVIYRLNLQMREKN